MESKPFRARRRALVALALAGPLVLAACSAPIGEAPPAAPVDAVPGSVADAAEPAAPPASGGSGETGGAGTATLRLDGDDGAFELAFCAIREDDILVHGPGSVAGGPAYLDIDFVWLDDEWFGEARIDLGTTEQFASSDEFLVFSTERGGGALIGSVPMMSMLEVVGEFFAGGEASVGQGTLNVEC